MSSDQTTRARGNYAETLAVGYLEKLGFEIVCRNYHAPGGEIDIVALEQGTLVFVEVRAREDERHGHPLETIGPQKIQRLIQTARHFLHELGSLELPMRFDVVSILMGDEPTIELVKEAFEA